MIALLLALPLCAADIQAPAPPFSKDMPAWPRPPVACTTKDGLIALPRLPIFRDRIRRPAPALDQVADWLHAQPDVAVTVHVTYWVSWVRSAQPARWRANAIRGYLSRRGIEADRMKIEIEEHLIPDAERGGDHAAVQALRRASTRAWLSTRPFTPSPRTACTDACKTLGRCTLKAGRCVATAESCRASTRCAREGACQLDHDRCSVGAPGDCRAATICKRDGRCHLIDGRCQIRDSADCAQTTPCAEDGACTLLGGRCQPGNDAQCRRSPACTQSGQCIFEDGQCVARKARDCRATESCRTEGSCTPRDGHCVVGGRRDCARSTACKIFGRCTPHQGMCRPRRDADCRASKRCKSHGLCSYIAYNCGAKTAADCRQSRACRVHKQCRPSRRGDCQR